MVKKFKNWYLPEYVNMFESTSLFIARILWSSTWKKKRYLVVIRDLIEIFEG